MEFLKACWNAGFLDLFAPSTGCKSTLLYIERTLFCVCIKITQTAVAVHPSTCQSLNSLAEWGGEQERQETAMDGLNCIFRHTSLHWGNSRRRGADSRRGVWMCVHKTQLYHTTQGCGGLGSQNSFECHDFGKAVPGERDQWFLLLVHRNADPGTV